MASLVTTVANACALHSVLGNESLKLLISRVESLPSLPSIYTELVDEIQSPDGSIQKVSEIISRDVAMTAKVLQLVNSPFFGLTGAQAVEAGVEDFEPARAVTHDQIHRHLLAGNAERTRADLDAENDQAR